MTHPDKCPRCGASRVIRLERTDAAFACGSQTQFSQRGFHESWDCVIRQRDQLAARVKELEAYAEKLENAGDAIVAGELDFTAVMRWHKAREKKP